MTETVVPTVYFAAPGAANTERTLQIARQRAAELGIKSIVVATTSGATGARAAEIFRGFNLVAVSHVTGFRGPDTQELAAANRERIIAHGGKVLTTTHAFAGLGRAVRRKLNTYQMEEIVAYTLRTQGEGMKVCYEITLMAADAGLISTKEEVIAIAGTGSGADTAVVLQPANVHDFFDLRLQEILCKPRF
jgi:hypothetical protein